MTPTEIIIAVVLAIAYVVWLKRELSRKDYEITYVEEWLTRTFGTMVR